MPKSLYFIGRVEFNPFSLQATLKDIRERDPTVDFSKQLYFLGNFAHYGPGPVEVLKTIEDLEATCIIGGAEQGLLRARRFYTGQAKPTRDPHSFHQQRIKEVFHNLLTNNRHFASTFTHFLHRPETFSFLEELPESIPISFAGRNVLLTSGSPMYNRMHIPMGENNLTRAFNYMHKQGIDFIINSDSFSKGAFYEEKDPHIIVIPEEKLTLENMALTEFSLDIPRNLIDSHPDIYLWADPYMQCREELQDGSQRITFTNYKKRLSLSTFSQDEAQYNVSISGERKAIAFLSSNGRPDSRIFGFTRAHYGVLSQNEEEVTFSWREIEYDHEALITSLERFTTSDRFMRTLKVMRKNQDIPKEKKRPKQGKIEMNPYEWQRFSKKVDIEGYVKSQIVREKFPSFEQLLKMYTIASGGGKYPAELEPQIVPKNFNWDQEFNIDSLLQKVLKKTI